jgi:hypothetical protein
MCSMHKNRGVKTTQLDDGIGDTLVLALEVLGNGRWQYQIALTDRGTVDAAIATNRHCPQPDVSSREEDLVNSDRAFAESTPLNWAIAILMAAAPKNGADQDRLLQTWLVPHQNLIFLGPRLRLGLFLDVQNGRVLPF